MKQLKTVGSSVTDTFSSAIRYSEKKFDNIVLKTFPKNVQYQMLCNEENSALCKKVALVNNLLLDKSLDFIVSTNVYQAIDKHVSLSKKVEYGFLLSNISYEIALEKA